MTEHNNQQTEQPTTEKAERDRSAFTTPEEANAAKPSSKWIKLYAVRGLDGRTAYTWAGNQYEAVGQVAIVAGWSAATAGKVASKEKVADMLAQLSDEDRKALLAQYGGKKGK